MFRSGGAPAPKQHASFNSRRQPVLQQIAAMSNFNGANGPMHAELKPEDYDASIQKKHVVSKNYKPTDIFFTEEQPEEEGFYEEEQKPPVLVNNVLGGQDTDDRYTTTVMMAQAGQIPAENKKCPRGVKSLSRGKGTFLWGDGPSNNYYELHNQKEKLSAEDEEGLEPPEPPLLTTLKKCLASRGANGILSLSKRFKIMDDDNSKTLDRKEFTKGMLDLGLRGLTPTDILELFKMFDIHGDGTIDYDEFLNLLRVCRCRCAFNGCCCHVYIVIECRAR